MQPAEQTHLITRADAGGPYGTPPLATCSYFEYTRAMGTPVRITRGAPRAALSRWTDQPRWPTVALLAPGASYFHKNLTPEQFRDRYLADLNLIGPRAVAAALRGIHDDGLGQLCLLCFEKTADVQANPLVCHRRIFADWFSEITGRQIPELTRLTRTPVR